MIRMFKVYAWKAGVSAVDATSPEINPDHEICLARNARMAAGIV